MDNLKGNIIVSGAGLCGTLMAIRLAQKNYKVSLYERRKDPRQDNAGGGRSINLALSDRGLKALNMIGARSFVDKMMIPMQGRLIHSIDGEKKLYPYSGRKGEHINSISRAGLNELLLNLADGENGVSIYFDNPIDEFDFEKTAIRTGQNSYVSHADAIIAADGAGSAMRKSILKHSNKLRFNFSQSYLDTGYKELSLPPVNGDWAIEKNALHIWPREGFMMIALPNIDQTFTLTLFMPFEGENGIQNLNEETEILDFFETNFPDLKPVSYTHLTLPTTSRV